MKDKQSDIQYCGVREDKIKSADPVLSPFHRKLSYDWMDERYKIHVRKDVQRLPSPWTENEILRQVKFCNVRREHDRQSQHLIRNIVENNNLSLADKMFNCLLFRMFNMWDPIQHVLEGPVSINDFRNINLDRTRERFADFDKKGGVTFTNAFNTGGLKQCLAFPELAVTGKPASPSKMMVKVYRRGIGVVDVLPYKVAKQMVEDHPGEYSIEGWEPHMGMRVVRFLKSFVTHNPHFFHSLLGFNSPLSVYEELRDKVEGLGPFLAYQVWVDFTYNPDYPFSENHFTIAGPGCRAGIDLLFLDKDGMTHEECIFWLRDNQDDVYRQYGYDRNAFWSAEEPYDRCMNVMQLENMFCELSKYTRCVEAVMRGEKPRGKVGYNGGEVYTAPKTQVRSINLLERMKK
ncbi:phospholipid-lipopolysaccharide ABC transporter [Klebsiella virus vB_KpnM-20]|nr:phospholipid-lipopolysaccharide ABC transporter [Klebsiella virus vB_KpnM-20]